MPDPALLINPELNGALYALITALFLFSGQKHLVHPQQLCLPVLGAHPSSSHSPQFWGRRSPGMPGAVEGAKG